MEAEKMELLAEIVKQNNRILDVLNPYSRSFVAAKDRAQMFSKADATVEEILGQNHRILDILTGNETETYEDVQAPPVYKNDDVINVVIAQDFHQPTFAHVMVTCRNSIAASLMHRSFQNDPKMPWVNMEYVLDRLLSNGQHKNELFLKNKGVLHYEMTSCIRKDGSPVVAFHFKENI